MSDKSLVYKSIILQQYYVENTLFSQTLQDI